MFGNGHGAGHGALLCCGGSGSASLCRPASGKAPAASQIAAHRHALRHCSQRGVYTCDTFAAAHTGSCVRAITPAVRASRARHCVGLPIVSV
ncbi:hypothetical protein AZ78_0185 [Lysobacter capsici AZ78]|uniref:Uncharacterized protein n=1 Tax=Lysobacter capsici AZ78 TaxID=1444315 RepID=A0A108U4Y3_9GAMM|nr:hypothetical protein AZ78_0185 [Lysobacter capsici AZ78]